MKGKALAVVGAAGGQYGGVWAHDATRKSFGIAGSRIVEDLDLSIPATSLDGERPREHAETVERLGEVVGKLIAEIGWGAHVVAAEEAGLLGALALCSDDRSLAGTGPALLTECLGPFAVC